MTNENRRDDNEVPTADPLHGEANTIVSGLTDGWGALVDEMERMAEQYRDDDWHVLEVHPGDVVPLTPDEDAERWGFDVVVPNDEIETLCDLVEGDSTLDEWDVFRENVDDVVFLLLVVRDDEREQAVFVPLYYRVTDVSGLARVARRRGQMRVHLRPLVLEPMITLSQDDPELFLADEGR